jgi:hypothetical protein
MKKIGLKLFFLAFVFAAVLLPCFLIITPVSADSNSLLWGNQAGNVKTSTKLGERDPRIMVAEFIQIFLGFLGIIALVLILVGGFKWMLSGGSEDKIGEAKKMIVAAAIGLLIILASYGIATFVINTLFNATNATS